MSRDWPGVRRAEVAVARARCTLSIIMRAVARPPWTLRLVVACALFLGTGVAGGVARAELPAPSALGPEAELTTGLRGSCGGASAGLDRVAADLARRRARGEPAPDLPELTAALHAERVAYVWPRSWVARSGSPDGAAALSRAFASFRASLSVRTRAVCGVSVLTLPTGEQIAAVVVVDAQGELVPLKERVRVGEWLTVEASLQGDFRGAQVMVRGPIGAARVIPGHFVQSTRKVRATFAPDAPGGFTVQVMGDTESGPRPVLEARVFADVSPSYAVTPAGPKGLGRDGASPDATLFQLVATLRRERGLPPLQRDPRLDALARTHVAAMMQRKQLAHDVGAGDPRSRLEASGLRANAVGENAATGREVAGLHRALTESPSHDANLGSALFDRVGVATVSAPDGALWGCELFAGGLR